MLKLGSAFRGYAIDASDGKIGTIADLLFDDRTWRVRWLVIDTGTWLPGRKVLLHPGCVGKANRALRELPAALTKAQVEGSPELSEHEPMSTQMEQRLYDYYYPGGTSAEKAFLTNPIATQYASTRSEQATGWEDRTTQPDDPESHLRSVVTITGYSIPGGDGSIGKVEDLLIDDGAWSVAKIVVETGRWWSRKFVLISPGSVRQISWNERELRLAITDEQVEASPPWTPWTKALGICRSDPIV
jgi:hypothetical protein